MKRYRVIGWLSLSAAKDFVIKNKIRIDPSDMTLVEATQLLEIGYHIRLKH